MRRVLVEARLGTGSGCPASPAALFLLARCSSHTLPLRQSEGGSAPLPAATQHIHPPELEREPEPMAPSAELGAAAGEEGSGAGCDERGSDELVEEVGVTDTAVVQPTASVTKHNLRALTIKESRI